MTGGGAIQAYEDHVAALEAGDVDAVVAGYAEDAILAGGDGVGRGRDHIRSVFTKFLAAGYELEPKTTVMHEDDVVFVTWTAGAGGAQLTGADTFVVRDGLIAVHSGFFTSTPLVDDRQAPARKGTTP